MGRGRDTGKGQPCSLPNKKRPQEQCKLGITYYPAFCPLVVWYQGFPDGSGVKNPPAVQEMQETGIPSLSQEDPLEKAMATYSSILAWKSHGHRSLVGYSPWGRKSRTELSDYTTTTNLTACLCNAVYREFHGLYSSWGRKESDRTE